ncbi:transcriptional regulator family: Fungal Specific TF [Penicillium hordei]|uniref:Transcriptional regulator family: Fungal Specific TF n=1 Tax=Penicillium hordei TaxID=40994 RepID=A0AAD6EBX5_9EURO|nr:transcriptional regulator family: Fungal Specific TF [Penicillium hordei]KAJ5607718.1 transcriptional regulator family: Fungal Specific TF [Penicillium hordei]
MIDLQIHFDGIQPNHKDLKPFSQPSPLSPWLNTISPGQRSDCDPMLMSYFEHIICSSSTLVDNAHYNPYRYLILLMALQSDGIYHAALAIAANTLKLSDQRYRLPALEHHHRALNHLRSLLNRDNWVENELDEILAELAWAREDGNIKINRKDVHQLETDLDSLQQKIPTENIDPSMECAAIAEANRLGARLFLHEICSTKAPINRSGIPTVESQEKNVYVERILTLMLEKKVNMLRTAVTPLWHLFLAGCCASREEERVTVLQLFKELEDIRRFGNITPAIEVVEMVWRQRDLSVQDERRLQKKLSTQRQKDPFQETRFSWEHAMVMLGGGSSA